MVLSLRLASMADAKILWEWATDPSVRANSFNPDEILWSNHLVWLQDHLESSDCRIWILVEDGRPVGQVRYDRVGTRASIGLSVGADQRGRGFGTLLLKLSLPGACRALDVDELFGLVKIGNVASARAFVAAGFQSASAASDRMEFTFRCQRLEDKE